MRQSNLARKKESQSRSLTIVKQDLLEQAARRDLQHALRTKQLDVYYQPQLNMKELSSTHFEALVRWTHPTLGFITPEVFIPIAEESGLIEQVTHFVIQRIVADISNWVNSNVPVTRVAVNISAKLISSAIHAERLLSLLTSIAEFAPYITLELTETAMVQSMTTAQSYMQRFRNLGYEIALDDFGTGFCSLAYLLDFPVDIIKLDRSFITALPHSHKGRTIIQSVIHLAQQLGLKVVAEGVENAEEMQILKDLGCTIIQGFHFSKPLPMQHIKGFIACIRAGATLPTSTTVRFRHA